MSAPVSPASRRRPDSLGWLGLEVFILVATGLSLAGWTLSLVGQLHGTAYAVVVGTGVLALFFHVRRRLTDLPSAARRPRFTIRRWRRPLPFLFGCILLLAALGGALYPPNNYDALTYRIPQLLHWLDTGHWHWIAASNRHLNITSPGFNWLIAPLLALTGSDRGFFLPSIVALALLPTVFFVVLRGCGVARRVAWTWMWLLPSGACYAMQAGGIGNDLLPTTLALAAVAFALRAGQQHRFYPLALSILAVALMTGVKLTAAPIALPWLAVALFSWKLLAARPWALLAVILVSLPISFVPTAVLNVRHTGDWSGDPENELQLKMDSPIHGLIGNSVMIAAANLAPPVVPQSTAVNAWFEAQQNRAAGHWLRHGYPRFNCFWRELASEENSGLGLALTGLALVSLAAGWDRRWPPRPGRTDPGHWISLAGGIAFAVFLFKAGSEFAPRLVAPYYPFLLVFILRLPGQEAVTRRMWWRLLAVLAAGSILAPLILTPARPLWPARSVLGFLAARQPESPSLRRSTLVYETYAQRHDYLAPLKAFLPPDTRVVGFLPTVNDMETTLWKPYGSLRAVEILTPAANDPALRQLPGGYVVTSPRALSERFDLAPEAYAARVGGRILTRTMLTQKAAIGPEEWVIIALP